MSHLPPGTLRSPSAAPAEPHSAERRLFPIDGAGGNGVTLREWYGGMALQALITAGVRVGTWDQLAEMALDAADAMMDAIEGAPADKDQAGKG